MREMENKLSYSFSAVQHKGMFFILGGGRHLQKEFLKEAEGIGVWFHGNPFIGVCFLDEALVDPVRGVVDECVLLHIMTP